jgi:RNA polymerase sigma factor (sigma-70 family)
MPPPPAELFASRIFLGPALRAQSDGRLVGLVREGYDSAFEEIVRRYRRPLERFAAAIVDGRSEDVTQDAFSKALLALRGSEAKIELRPWLYRIVRNTALNDLRDRGPAVTQLSETLAGSASAAVEVERREELADLMKRLGALPEPQRAAIVMRELEGLSHEEIAAALGVSGGAARQAIYRARAALRDGLGLLLPMPVLRALIDHAGDAAPGGDAVAAGAAATAAGGAVGGLGASGAFKVGLATVLLAGTVGAGVAIEHEDGAGPAAASAAPGPGGGKHDSSLTKDAGSTSGNASRRGRGDPRSGEGEQGPGGRHEGGGVSSGKGAQGVSGGDGGGSGPGSGDRSGPGRSGGGNEGSGGGDLGGVQSDGGSGGDNSGTSSGSGGDEGSLSGGSSGEDGGTSGSSGDGGGSGGESISTTEPVTEESSGVSGSSSGSGSSGDLTSSDSSGSDGST